MRKKLIAIGSFFLALTASIAGANDLYSSFSESIDKANSQARVNFVSGTYISEVGDSKMVWYLEGGNRANISFYYANRTLQNGSVNFTDPLKVEIRAASGLCSVFTIKKLTFETGGALDPDNSDFILTPPSPTECNYSRNALLLEDHLALSLDSGKFFHGQAFAATPHFRKCIDETCTETTQGSPISKVVFFSKLLPDGSLEAISVSMRTNATLRLPNNGGWLQLDSGSVAAVSSLSYDLVKETGDAFINEIIVNVKAGSIYSDDNVINLEKGSQVKLSSIEIEQSPGITLIKNGDILGSLGSQSIIILSSENGKKSTAIFDEGRIDLKSVKLSYSNDISRFSAQYAKVSGTVRDALLNFSDRNSLSFSNASIQIDLRCENAQADCDGVQWSSDGEVHLTGTISPLEMNINGGSWSLDSSNTLKVVSGTLAAPLLRLDTEAAFFPISGVFNRLEMDIAAQDFKLSSGVNAALASVRLSSDNLVLDPNEGYPYGEMSFSGSLNSLILGNMDRVGVADALIDLSLSRKQSDVVRVMDGTVNAAVTVRTSNGDYGSASLNISNLRSYRSDVDADFGLSVDSLSTLIKTPAGSTTATEGGNLGKIEAIINVKEVPISASLSAPMVMNGKISVRGSDVNIDEIADVPLAIAIALPQKELVYINVNAKPPAGGGFNICNPKVTLGEGSYIINGSSSFSVERSKVRFGVDNFKLSSDISMSADDRNCSYVAGLICGAIGAIAGPGGAAAGAYLCASQVENAESEASTKFNDAIRSTLSSYRYSVGQ